MLDGLYVERRTLVGTTVSRDIAHHLYARQMPGQVVIITPRPAVFMASVSKQWAKVVRQVQRQRASTLNPARLQELMWAITHMQTIKFSIRADGQGEELAKEGNSGDKKEATASRATTSVLLLTQEEATLSPPSCHTMYITEEVGAEATHALTSAMLSHGLVVLYDLAELTAAELKEP